MQLNQFISKFIKIIVPLIYGFVATFVIVVYVSIIIPAMNVVDIKRRIIRIMIHNKKVLHSLR